MAEVPVESTGENTTGGRARAKFTQVTHMLNLPSLYIANTLLRPALIVACIVIGLTMRVALIVQPGTRFRSYWRLFFKKTLRKNLRLGLQEIPRVDYRREVSENT
jgi:hypothetical protein